MTLHTLYGMEIHARHHRTEMERALKTATLRAQARVDRSARISVAGLRQRIGGGLVTAGEWLAGEPEPCLPRYV